MDPLPAPANTGCPLCAVPHKEWAQPQAPTQQSSLKTGPNKVQGASWSGGAPEPGLEEGTGPGVEQLAGNSLEAPPCLE